MGRIGKRRLAAFQNSAAYSCGLHRLLVVMIEEKEKEMKAFGSIN